MSKNKDGGFSNRAAKLFSRDMDDIEQMSEKEIMNLLRDEIRVILNQITNSKRGQKYPNYAVNMFANVSSAKFIYLYIDAWMHDIKKNGDSDMMEPADVFAMRKLVSEGYLQQHQKFQNQQLDEKLRTKYLLKAYAMIDPEEVKIASKLGLSKKSTIELAIRARQHPKYSIQRVATLFNQSSKSPKKKLKILKKLTDKSFTDYIGASLTLDRDFSDFMEMTFNVVMPKKFYDKLEKAGKKKRKKLLKKEMKRRKPFIAAYATIFKKRKSFSKLLTDGFYEKNKKLIKKLIKKDAGFKKAFSVIRQPGKLRNDTEKTLNDKWTTKNRKAKMDKEKAAKQTRPVSEAKKNEPAPIDLATFMKSVRVPEKETAI